MEKTLEELYRESLLLKKSLELIDLINERSNSEDLVIKHLIFKPTTNVKIKMYQENHNEPHVHVDIGRGYHDASISINTQQFLAGSIERKYEKKVLNWIEKNKDKLIIIWNNMQAGQSIDLSILN